MLLPSYQSPGSHVGREGTSVMLCACDLTTDADDSDGIWSRPYVRSDFFPKHMALNDAVNVQTRCLGLICCLRFQSFVSAVFALGQLWRWPFRRLPLNREWAMLDRRCTYCGATHEDDDEGAQDPSDPHHPGHPQEQDHTKDEIGRASCR